MTDTETAVERYRALMRRHTIEPTPVMRRGSLHYVCGSDGISVMSTRGPAWRHETAEVIELRNAAVPHLSIEEVLR